MNNEIKSKEDCEWFGIRTIQKPCGQCDKNCQYNDNNPQKEIEKLKKVLEDQYTFKTTQIGPYDSFNIIINSAIEEFAKKIKLRMYRKSIIQLKDDKSPNLYTDDMEKVIDDLLKEYRGRNTKVYDFLIAYICQNDRVMTDIEYATSQEEAIKYFRLRDKTSRIIAVTIIEEGVKL